MATTEVTDKQRLATILLGQPVRDWIVGQRHHGYSWREISKMLTEATDGSVVISHESVRQWSES